MRDIPRKWEYIANLLEHIEPLYEKAKELDDIMVEVYGEDAHTEEWMFDIWNVIPEDPTMEEIADLAYSGEYCYACHDAKYRRESGLVKCEVCLFAKKAGICDENDSMFAEFMRLFWRIYRYESD